MFAAIIFAASISSPSIGEFYSCATNLSFSLPASLDAAHTPGNSSATNNLSLRIDKNALAAVVAAQEAFFERLYYWSAGDDTQSYPGRRYLADVPPTNVAYGVSLEDSLPPVFPVVGDAHYYYNVPSNRVLSTLRFDWPVYAALCEWLPSGIEFPWGKTSKVYFREGGAYGAGLEEGNSLLRLPLSLSTSLDLGGDLTAFPSFGWTPTADLPKALSGWRGVFPLASCEPDDVFAMFDKTDTVYIWGATYYRDRLPYMAEEIATYCLTNGSAATQFCSNKVIASQRTYTNILASAFGTAPCYALITNDSRRLLYDRLAAYNQAVAAADRNVFLGGDIDLFFPQGGGLTATRYWTSATSAGTFSAANIQLQSDGSLRIANPTDISWGANTVSNSTASVIPEGVEFSMQESVSMTRINKGVVGDSVRLFSVQLTASDFQDLVNQLGLEGEAVVYVSPLTLRLDLPEPVAELTFSDAYGYPFGYQLTYPIADYFPLPGTVAVFAAASGGYTHERPILSSYANAVLNSPCARAFDTGRVREVEIAVLSPLWESVDDVTVVGFDTLARSRCTTFLGTTKGGLESELRGVVHSLIGDMATIVSQRLGGNPASGNLARSYVLDAIEGVKDHAYIDSASLSVVSTSNLTAHITYDPGTKEIESLVFSDGVGFAGSVSVDVSPASNSSAPVVANPRYAVGTSPQVFERVDWNFHTLRLNHE